MPRIDLRIDLRIVLRTVLKGGEEERQGWCGPDPGFPEQPPFSFRGSSRPQGLGQGQGLARARQSGATSFASRAWHLCLCHGGSAQRLCVLCASRRSDYHLSEVRSFRRPLSLSSPPSINRTIHGRAVARESLGRALSMPEKTSFVCVRRSLETAPSGPFP